MQSKEVKKPNKSKASISERLISSGTDPKKLFASLALLDLAVIGVLGVLFYLKKINYVPLAIGVVAVLFIDYFYLDHCLGKNKRESMKMESEFVQVFEYFGIYVRNGAPVYTALQEVIPLSSPALGKKISDLLKAVDNDKTIVPYLDFASSFSSLSLRQVMVSVYLMSEEGGSEVYFRQYSVLFDNLASNQRRVDKAARLDKLDNLAIFPLIGSALTMLLITVGLVTMIGGLVGGI